MNKPVTRKGKTEKPRRHKNPNWVSHKELVNALKVAFCYMPEDEEITDENYLGDQLGEVKREVNQVKRVLGKLGIDHTKVFEQLNPHLAQEPRQSNG